MKIYKVTYKSIYLDEGEDLVTTTVFLNKDVALIYLQSEKAKLKQQEIELDLEDYSIYENEELYERYLDGRFIEDQVSIWLDEDETYDEKMLQELQKAQNEKDKDYEM